MSFPMGLSTRRAVSFRAIAAIALSCLLSSPSLVSAAPANNGTVAARREAKRAAAELTALHNDINQKLGLTRSSLVPLQIVIEAEQPFMMQFVHEGQLYTLDMFPESVRANHYQVLEQVADGSFVSHEPGPMNTFRGTILEIPGSEVAGGSQSGGVYLVATRPGNERIWIESVQMQVPGAPADLHVVYSDSDRAPLDVSCGTDHSDVQPVEDFGVSRGAACGTGLCFAELACDADVEFFNSYGSVSAVEDRINSVIAAMNVQYERDVDITHVITAIVVRTVEPDPYSSTSSNTLVSQLRNQWETTLDHIPRDITHLFSGKNIDGSTIGQAFNIGVVCSDQSYSYASTGGWGPQSFAQIVELSAHENGHVWNGIHCACSGFTMNTPLNSNPLGAFSAGNITRITLHRDQIGCLGTSAGLDPPFIDEFNSVVIDNAKWTLIQGADVNSLGNNEPSGGLSLNINGTDSMTTNSIDLSIMPGGPSTYLLTYWWQRTGSANSPEPGENLLIEYLNNLNQWVVINTHLGDGPDNDPFQFVSITLPPEARHPFFRLRIRGTSPNPGSDDFFIDDIGVIGVIPPDNNDTCGVSPITVTEGTRAISTVNASTDGTTVAQCGGQLHNDIWYRYFPSCNGTVTIDVCDASFDARIAVYLISCGSSAVACDDNSCGGGSPRVTFNAMAGFTYWIRIGATVNGVTGTGTLNIACPVPANGACCLTDGSCSSMTQAACTTAGGTYQGDGVACGGVTCPQPEGACCISDGSCTVGTATDCTNAGGTYQGNGTNCGGVTCPQPEGACCISDGSCTFGTAADCSTAGGTYQGDGVDCVTAACPPACPADLAKPLGVVDVFDLFILLGNWNTSGAGAELAAPLDNVDVFDLFILLGTWGDC